MSYVPWDVSRATDLLSVIKSAIGSGSNVGIVVFGIILSIAVVIKVVKYFTK